MDCQVLVAEHGAAWLEPAATMPELFRLSDAIGTKIDAVLVQWVGGESSRA